MRTKTLLAGLFCLGMMGIAAAADVSVKLVVSDKEVVRIHAHHLRRCSHPDDQTKNPRQQETPRALDHDALWRTTASASISMSIARQKESGWRKVRPKGGRERGGEREAGCLCSVIRRSRPVFCHRMNQPLLVLVACALLATLTWASAQGTMYLDNMNGNPLPAILFMSTKDTSSAYEPSTTFDNQVQT